MPCSIIANCDENVGLPLNVKHESAHLQLNSFCDEGKCTNLTNLAKGKSARCLKCLYKVQPRQQLGRTIALSCVVVLILLLAEDIFLSTLHPITDWGQGGAPVRTLGSRWRCAGPPGQCWRGSTSADPLPQSSHLGLCLWAGQRQTGRATSRLSYLGWLCPRWPGHVFPTCSGEACWLPPWHSAAKNTHKNRGKCYNGANISPT